ncbi:hypothetical protein Nepgr_003558 [Nepenthes gracilis]|uniref:Uncharacterized protein n=1 Tax=Nepenthes gracilis TaxID=150966 RepID=A0AAD3RZQ2_NEPGR|nr:hypothetical protein Nepgr_003558 [Nepenthes gracilis]
MQADVGRVVENAADPLSEQVNVSEQQYNSPVTSSWLSSAHGTGVLRNRSDAPTTRRIKYIFVKTPHVVFRASKMPNFEFQNYIKPFQLLRVDGSSGSLTSFNTTVMLIYDRFEVTGHSVCKVWIRSHI